jgi:hypothetical protein
MFRAHGLPSYIYTTCTLSDCRVDLNNLKKKRMYTLWNLINEPYTVKKPQQATTPVGWSILIPRCYGPRHTLYIQNGILGLPLGSSNVEVYTSFLVF